MALTACVISDTHCNHDELKLFDADILIHCGDFTNSGSVNQIASFNRWLIQKKAEHKYKKIIVVPGNHDWLFQKDVALARMLLSEAVVLIDEPYEYEGIKFYGSPRTPEFYNWAFMHERGEDIERFWKLIPEGIDVLITHGPPHGFRDAVPYQRVGCADLTRHVERVKPKHHLFGHIHFSYGTEKHYQHDITFVNAAICDESYWIRNEPVLISIPSQQDNLQGILHASTEH